MILAVSRDSDPIEVDSVSRAADEEVGRSRVGMAQCAFTPDITTDWWRHCRELIPPEDYLIRPYLDSWAQTDFAIYIEAGWISLEEVDRRGSLIEVDEPLELPSTISVEDILKDERNHAVRYHKVVESKPLFSEGQSIVTNKEGVAGHTRLPRYARGIKGAINAYRGARNQTSRPKVRQLINIFIRSCLLVRIFGRRLITAKTKCSWIFGNLI